MLGRSGKGALTRRFEQRWASRFILPVASNVPKNINGSTPAAKTKEKRGGVNGATAIVYKLQC
jgi:hypothetical protein